MESEPEKKSCKLLVLYEIVTIVSLSWKEIRFFLLFVKLVVSFFVVTKIFKRKI